MLGFAQESALEACESAYKRGDYRASQVMALHEISLNPEPIVKMHLHKHAGDAFRALSDYPRAGTHYEYALQIARQFGDSRYEAIVFSALGRVAGNQGAYPAARAYYNSALDLFRASADEIGIAETLINLATIALRRGDLDSAQRYHEDGLQLSRQLNHTNGIARSLCGLAEVAAAGGDYTAARHYLQSGRELWELVGDKRNTARTLNDIAKTLAHLGEWQEAQRYSRQALEIRQQIGDQKGTADSLQNLGWIAYLRNDLGRAGDLFTASLAIQEHIGYRYGMAQTTAHLGFVALGANRSDEARHHLHQALLMAYQIGAQPIGKCAILGFAILMQHDPAFSARLLGSVRHDFTLLAKGFKRHIDQLHQALSQRLPATLLQDHLDDSSRRGYTDTLAELLRRSLPAS
jgi:tetratricopeptide (TPR) repeat protein